MSPSEAKRIAALRGYEFYWDTQQRAYTCYPKDGSDEASYHTKETLRNMDAVRFQKCYLPQETK